MKKRHLMILTAALLAVSLLLAACQNGTASGETSSASGTAAAPAAPAAEKEALTAAVLCGDMGDDDLSAIQASLKETMPDALYYDAGGDPALQKEQVSEALVQGAGILFVSPAVRESSEEAMALTALARDAGALLVFYGRPMEVPGTEGSLRKGEDRVWYVGTDPKAAGRAQGAMAGKYAADRYEALDLNGDGKISYALFKGQAGQGEAAGRAAGAAAALKDALKKAGHEEPVFFDSQNADGYQLDLTGTWSSHAVRDYMETNLSLYREKEDNMIELVLCGSDAMAEGAVAALQAAGYNTGEEGAKTIPVFGIGAAPDGKALLEAGALAGTVSLHPEETARVLGQIAENAACGLAPETGLEDLADPDLPILRIPCSAVNGK